MSYTKLKEVKPLTKEWTATQRSDAKQIATTREDLDSLMKQLNSNPITPVVQEEVKKKKEELINKLKKRQTASKDAKSIGSD